ncbi:hypothetical protein EC957_010656 [Mortierella hygrophila]|uniref:Uncharacterized protein n=1 Tax=Mortierella hygrophila TaxID=979708 RepID=A0A9P6EWF3_9FUNG|nr:hypothetical protein EC957_010656 [Mortierella hygrophila]
MIKGSEPFVETIITENASEQKQHSAVPSDAPHVSNTPYQTSDTLRLASSAKSAGKDHAKRTRTTTTRVTPTKRMRLQDPWHELADVALCLYNGNAVDLPSEETKDTEKDPERQKLYGLAWRHLREAKNALGQQNTDNETCLHFRDAFVALSGVLNLYSPIARKALACADCIDAKGLCLMPELELKDEELTKLLDSLKTTKTRKLNAVLEDVYSWLSSKPTFRLFLLVLRNIIENILNPHHGDNKPSECDALLIWGSILKDGRPKGTPFTFYLASTPPVAVKIQLRKNIKIARSVMLDLSKFGLDCPPQLSLHGLQADVFRVVPWKGVFVAAPACDPIVLPTTEAAWNVFIENTAHHLKNLLEYYHEYAVDAKEKIDIFNYTRNTVGQGEEEESKGVENESDLEGKEGRNEGDLNEEIEFIDWNDVIFHTPTKPRVTRTIVATDKPNNQRFQQRVQDAMAEHKYDGNDEDGGYDDDGK